MSGAEIRDSGGMRKYRTEIPNLILDMNLDPYTFRLYCHFKRVAGDSGQCWQSRDTIVKATGISAGQVSKSTRILLEKHLIAKTRREHNQTSIIELTDIWLQNMQQFGPSPHDGGPSPRDTEEETHEEGKKSKISSADAELTPQQTYTNEVYEGIREAHGVQIEPSEYGFHVGKFRRIIDKKGASEEEIARVIAHMVALKPSRPTIDAVKALEDVRFGRDTGEAWSGPAPWEGKNEPLNPASDEAMTKRDKPNAPTWYATFYPVSISVAESMLKEHDTHSAMLDALERRSFASA